jgi:hypothetical protein
MLVLERKLMKKWFYTEFFPDDTDPCEALEEVLSFLNKHNLKPEEVKIVTNRIDPCGNNRSIGICGFGLFYYAKKKLSARG